MLSLFDSVHTVPSEVSVRCFPGADVFENSTLQRIPWVGRGGNHSHQPVLVKSGCHLKNKTKHTECLTQQEGISHNSGDWKVKIKASADQGIGESFLPGFQMAASSLCPPMAEGEQEPALCCLF